MSNEEIKNECEAQYAAIETAKNRLKELRNVCKHEETFEGNYSWRIGAIVTDIDKSKIISPPNISKNSAANY